MTLQHPRGLMHGFLRPQSGIVIQGMRSPHTADIPALSRLMLAAYRGTIDDEQETEADALLEINKTFNDEYGLFVPECSRVVAAGDGLSSAALITRWQDRPFLAFSITAPEHKRKGLARACLVSAMEELRQRGDHELRLVVTLANLPARRLYESLGFVLSD